MPPVVAGAVLGSALLHAAWNALAKAIPHRLLASALMGTAYLVGGGLWCVLAPVPDRASWPFLATSAILQTGYLLLLTAAYSHGEFRRVYPVARGTAPLLVTVVALTVLHERLHAGQLAGVALVVAALAGLVIVPRGRIAVAAGGGRARSGLGLAAATGVVIAAYSLVDGLGVRQSGSAAGYAAWLMFVQGPLLVGTCMAVAGPRRMAGWLRGDAVVTVPPVRPPSAAASDVRSPRAGGVVDQAPGTTVAAAPASRAGRRMGGGRPGVMIAAGLVGGVLSLAAYAIVLWAQSRASLSLVSALRETSVLFAGLIGAVLFAEGFSVRQTVAAIGVVAGIALIQLG